MPSALQVKEAMRAGAMTDTCTCRLSVRLQRGVRVRQRRSEPPRRRRRRDERNVKGRREGRHDRPSREANARTHTHTPTQTHTGPSFARQRGTHEQTIVYKHTHIDTHPYSTLHEDVDTHTHTHEASTRKRRRTWWSAREEGTAQRAQRREAPHTPRRAHPAVSQA